MIPTDVFSMVRSSTLYRKIDVERFLKLVGSGGPNDCWHWLGRYDSITGYGSAYPLYNGCRPNRGSHRIMMELILNRRLYPKEFVCHYCDNRLCCNPNHLYVGTHQENTDDRTVAGRTSRGEQHSKTIKTSTGIIANRGEGNHQSKLKEAQVREIRRLFDSGEMNRHQLSRKYGLHPSTVSSIVFRETWKYI